MNSTRKRKLKVATEFTLFAVLILGSIVGVAVLFAMASAILPEWAIAILLGLLFIACLFGWGYING